jgi:hypothetical protein
MKKFPIAVAPNCMNITQTTLMPAVRVVERWPKWWKGNNEMKHENKVTDWITWLSEATGEDLTNEIIAIKHHDHKLYVVFKEYPAAADVYSTDNLYGECEYDISIADFRNLPYPLLLNTLNIEHLYDIPKRNN